jgi:hypothetical protein
MRKLRAVSFILFFGFSRFAFAEDFEIRNVGASFQKAESPGEVQITEYFSERPPEVVFNSPKDIKNCKIDGAACDPSVPIPLKLKASDHRARRFVLRFDTNGKKNEIAFNVLGKGFPEYTVLGESSLKDFFVLSPFAAAAPGISNDYWGAKLLILRPDGSIYFYRHLQEVGFDFQPFSFGGRQFYSYLLAKRGFIDLTTEGNRVILDDRFNVVKTLDKMVDMHEFSHLGPDHYLWIESRKIKTPLGGCMLGHDIVEEKNGKISFQMNTADLLKQGLTYIDPLLSAYLYEDEQCRDIFHLNTVQIVDEDHLLLGMLHSVVMYDKKKKKVDWVYGGPESVFPLAPEMKNAGIHTSHWDAKTQTLTFLKNNSEGNISAQLIEVGIDPKALKLKTFKILYSSTFPSKSMGSQYAHGGDVYTLGFGLKVVPNMNDIVEIKSGKPVMEIRFLDPFCSGYRVHRMPEIK